MSEEDDNKRIRALMGDISRAFIERDVATLDGIFDADFTLSDPYGAIVGKEQWLADVASGALAIESVQSDAFELRRAGDEVHVRGQLTLKARYSKSDYNGSFKYIGVYRKHGDAWKLLLSSARRLPA